MERGRYYQEHSQYSRGYYQDKVTEGIEFQNLVIEHLFKRGLAVHTYLNKTYKDNRHGLREFRAEIKKDSMFTRTNNLYIETEWKKSPKDTNFIPSGPYRKGCKLFIIGNSSTIYIFSSKKLKEVSSEYFTKEKTTSKGFLLPVEDAERYCVIRVDLQE